MRKISRKYYDRMKRNTKESLVNPDRNSFNHCSCIVEMDSADVLDSKPSQLGLNWSACGDCTVEEAKDFVKWLTLRIKMAEAFNEIFKDAEIEEED